MISTTRTSIPSPITMLSFFFRDRTSMAGGREGFGTRSTTSVYMDAGENSATALGFEDFLCPDRVEVVTKIWAGRFVGGHCQ
jgi:hypothetical protein